MGNLVAQVDVLTVGGGLDMAGMNVTIDKKPTRVAIVPCNGEGICEGTATGGRQKNSKWFGK